MNFSPDSRFMRLCGSFVSLVRINLLWLLAIGVLVQFGWEAGLLLGGIRSAGFSDFGEKLRT